MNPTPDQIRSRQTAYLATEAWWRSRVKRFRSDWLTFGQKPSVSGTYDAGYRDATRNCAETLQALLDEWKAR